MEDKEIIAAAIGEFIAAYNAGDIAGVLSYYTDDLIKVRHGAAPETKAETADRLVQVFKAFSSRVEATVDEIGISGEMAFTRGELQVTLIPKSAGEPQKIMRRYLEIWRRENGRWRVARTMDNVG